MFLSVNRNIDHLMQENKLVFYYSLTSYGSVQKNRKINITQGYKESYLGLCLKYTTCINVHTLVTLNFSQFSHRKAMAA